MTDDNQNNLTSFWEFLSNQKVEIPIIQRDYAQGRIGQEKLREKFLLNLKKALDDDELDIKLDFVYGNLENNILNPFDGQQRLTTLWLLHWYIAYKLVEANVKMEINDEVKKIFKNFTYETRTSSREFCEKLADFDIIVDETTLKKNISDIIQNQTWFYSEWKQDPTIQNMLNMLGGTLIKDMKNNDITDGIEEVFKECDTNKFKEYWEKLKGTKCPINFYVYNLNNYNLSDDIYIKMNARGKQLTAFENFKAEFEKYIKDNDFEENTKNDSFFYKIDREWTDFFWKNKDKQIDDNQIDDKMLKFISGIAINSYAKFFEIYENEQEVDTIKIELENKKEKNITDDYIKRARIEKRIQKLFNDSTELIPKDFSTENTFMYLKNCFNKYSFVDVKKLNIKDLPLWDLVKNNEINTTNTEVYNNLFLEFIKKEPTTYKQRVLFFAQTEYLLNNEELDSEKFIDWMRVVRNIVQNSTIDSANTFLGAVGLINELSNGCKDIYYYLSNNIIKSYFAQEQVSEEKEKALIIQKDKNYKNSIHKCEDTNFFKGNISFALYCIDYEKNNNSFNNDLFIKIIDVVEKNLSEKDISNDFRRALLTIKGNDFYKYWWSWSYSTGTEKRRLIENTYDLRKFFTKKDTYGDYLKDLLKKLTEKTLNEIIDECTLTEPNWKHELIKKPELLNDYCPYPHYFGILTDNSACFLFKDKRRPKSIKDCFKVE